MEFRYFFFKETKLVLKTFFGNVSRKMVRTKNALMEQFL